MRAAIGLALLALLVGSAVSAAVPAKALHHSPYVQEVTDSTASVLAEGEWLLLLYAEWCGVCVRFAPDFDAVAQSEGKEPSSRIRFARYSCIF